MTYVRTNWVNDQTPLNADNMNNIENGIEQALAQGGAIVITSGGSATEKTFTIPTLTNKQVADVYNALASGKPCIVDSQDGTEHYIVDNANGSTIAINIVYSNKLIVTYTENSGAEDANATISSVELGGSNEKLYLHSINIESNSIAIVNIYTKSQSPFNLTTFGEYLAANGFNSSNPLNASGQKRVQNSTTPSLVCFSKSLYANASHEVKMAYDILGITQVDSDIKWSYTSGSASASIMKDTVAEVQ